MTGCELVVVAHYESRETFNAPTDEGYKQGPEPHAKMVLRVERVLKGKVQPGATIEVFLEHLYSVQTGVVGWDSWIPRDKNAKPDPTDGIPKLCYQQQMMNPGPLMPVPILRDAREPAIYFLPKAGRLALAQSGQVQPMAWENGWKQALDGKPMDIVFCLAQNVSTPLRREALEELYAQRDASALDRLFQIAEQRRDSQTLREWRWWRFYAAGVLIAVGDKRGDVYSRARARNLFGVMARVSPERALRDITRFIEKAVQNGRAADVSTEQAVYALAAFDESPAAARQAMMQLLQYLAQPRLANSAVASIRELLSADNYDGLIGKWIPKPHHLSKAEWEELRAWAKPLILAALENSDLGANPKKELEKIALSYWPPQMLIDMTDAEKVLLDPDPAHYQYDYRDMEESEADGLLRAIKQLADPKWIPLLVRVLRENPVARREHYYGLMYALQRYAEKFPDQLRSELIAQKLDIEFSSDEFDKEPWRWLPAAVGLPKTLGHLETMYQSAQGRELLRKYPPNDNLVNDVRTHVDNRGTTDLTDYDLLFFLAPELGASTLDEELEFYASQKIQYGNIGWRNLLSLAVAHGHTELKGEWIEAAREVFQQTPAYGKTLAALELLRASDEPADVREYLRVLDAMKPAYHPLYINQIPTDEFWPNDDYARLHAMLYPKHRAEYSRRVLKLLESPSLPERQVGESALKAIFKNAEFRAANFASQRAVQIQKLRQLLHQ